MITWMFLQLVCQSPSLTISHFFSVALSISSVAPNSTHWFSFFLNLSCFPLLSMNSGLTISICFDSYCMWQAWWLGITCHVSWRQVMILPSKIHSPSLPSLLSFSSHHWTSVSSGISLISAAGILADLRKNKIKVLVLSGQTIKSFTPEIWVFQQKQKKVQKIGDCAWHKQQVVLSSLRHTTPMSSSSHIWFC